jgi:hypothetical protein
LGNGEKGVSFIIFGLSTCDGTDFYFILLFVKLAIISEEIAALMM